MFLAQQRINAEGIVCLILVIGVALMIGNLCGYGVAHTQPVRHLLDDVLFHWTKLDPYRCADLLKSTLCLGATGSGKSSTVAKHFGEAIIKHPKSSMLILCPKQADVRDWRRFYSNADREDDLLVFEPEGKLRFNPLAYILKSGGDCRDVTKCLTSVAETLGASDGGKVENADFFEEQKDRNIYNGTVCLKLATGTVSAPDLQRFLTGAANTAAEIASDEWRAGFHNEILKAAYYAVKTPEEEADYGVAKEYFIREYPNMADRTRSSIMTGVFGLLHYLNTGKARQLLSGETNVSPDDMLKRGKSIAVNAPPALYGDTGKIINGVWKFATQWSVLRRDPPPGDYFNVIFADEAQQFVDGMDSSYLAQCRGHLGCMIFFSQSRHAFYAAMPGETGKHRAEALFANFNLKVFCALASPSDAEWASDLCGRELTTFVGGSVPPNESMFDTLMGRSRVTSNFSQHMERCVEPKVFMHKLRTGGAANRFMVDAIAIKTGEPFADGKNWKQTSFSQR